MTTQTFRQTQTSASHDEEMDAVVVAKIHGRDVTRKEFREAFDLVADSSNWKNPIDAVVYIGSVPRDEEGFRLDLMREAVVFFTGSVPSYDLVRFSDGSAVVRVRAAGYYAAIGA